MKITMETVVSKLKAYERVAVLCHKNPDGDAIGSAYALYYGLKALGKSAYVDCSDPFPEKYNYMFDASMEVFAPDIYVSVDVADRNLLGKLADCPIDLAIDHHASHREFANYTYVVPQAASTTEIIYEIFLQLDININQLIANCLYTGLSTDTGCFRFSNTTANTHIVGAKLLNAGAEHVKINQLMFENKSKQRIMLERNIINEMEFYAHDRISLVTISKDDLVLAGDEKDTFDGISAISRQVSGVQIGITVRYLAENEYKISLRTSEDINAAAICNQFGGGGHLRAAGCSLSGDLETVKKTIVDACTKVLDA